MKARNKFIGVEINHHKRKLWPVRKITRLMNSWLKEQHLTKKKRFKPYDLTSDPRVEFRALYKQLTYYGHSITGKHNASAALMFLGYNVLHYLRQDEIIDYFRRVIIHSMEDILQEKVKGREGLEEIMKNEGPLAFQAFRASVSYRKKELRLPTIINAIGREYHKSNPDPRLHGRKLYDIVVGKGMNIHDLSTTTQDLYFHGENLSRFGLESSGHEKISHSTRRHLINGQTSMFGAEAFHRTMADILRIPDLTSHDLYAGNQSARADLSNIAEREVLLMLSIVQKYDPHCTFMGEDFKRIFGSNIQTVGVNDNELRILGGTLESEFADGRIITDKEDILIEVKTYESLKKRGVKEAISKYKDHYHWSSGKRITKKIIIMNTPDKSLDTHIHNNGHRDFKILKGSEFAEFYNKSMELLQREDPQFFLTAPIPVYEPDVLRGINKIIHERPYLIMVRGRQVFRNWAAEMLYENLHGLRSGKRVPDREHIEFESITPFSDFDYFYGGRQNFVIDDVVFEDAETFGTNRHIDTVASIALAYSLNGQMVVHTFFARNPLEEHRMLVQVHAIKSRFKKICNFNGKTFDGPFMNKREIVHRIRPHSGSEVIDLIEDYREYAQDQAFPKHGLKVFESMMLGKHRVGDISGEDIPEAYKRVIYGGDDYSAKKIIKHVNLDTITTAIMYHRKYKMNHYMERDLFLD
jgi:uncharacterized protein YprB with RNaseH-like and TPR domain